MIASFWFSSAYIIQSGYRLVTFQGDTYLFWNPSRLFLRDFPCSHDDVAAFETSILTLCSCKLFPHHWQIWQRHDVVILLILTALSPPNKKIAIDQLVVRSGFPPNHHVDFWGQNLPKSPTTESPWILISSPGHLGGT